MNKVEEKRRNNDMAVKEAKISEDGLKPQPAGGDASASGNVDKIRDILFGTQMRDYEKRFSRLEERLLKESSDLRADVKRRFDALEGYVKKEVESLADRLKAEQSERAESVKEVSQELKNLTKNFDKKTTQLDEQLTKGQRDLRQQLLDQSKNLSAEIRQKHDELSGLLEREAAELNEAKVDRSALAALFTEVALRLNNEFKIPGSE